MKFILLFGPEAVGKMSVGHELEKITDLKLFHNHMTIDLVSNFFDYGTEPGKKLVGLFREEIFKAVSSSDLSGLIFTYVWYFDSKEDWDYTEKIAKIFKEKGAEIYYVELVASLEERVNRNKTEHRLNHKPSKRDIELSESRLKNSMLNHRLNSNDGEIQEKNYIKINNTNLSPTEVALRIKEQFNF